jgi:hypothetical protein
MYDVNRRKKYWWRIGGVLLSFGCVALLLVLASEQREENRMG